MKNTYNSNLKLLQPDNARSAVVNLILDHLVDALGSDPGCTMRRAIILTDIDENPGTTQAEILGRMGVHKSALNRDIEWLYDHGCVVRQPAPEDARILRLRACGYAKKNLDFALKHFDYSHKNLKTFLEGFVGMFGTHKPTLRDAKIVSFLGHKKSVTRQEIFDNLYGGATTTDNRAVNNLINFGLVQRSDET